MNDPLTPLVAQLKERRSVTFQEKLKTLDIRDEIWRKCKTRLRMERVFPSLLPPLSLSLSLSLLDIELNRNLTADSNVSQRIGLCADMCCERERITREFQRLFKSYELDPDTRAVSIRTKDIHRMQRSSSSSIIP
jgi:hypothetical protein